MKNFDFFYTCRQIIFVLLIAAPSFTFAESTVVRTVNVARLIDESIPGQRLQNDLRAEAQKVEALQRRLAGELSSLEREIQESQGTLSAAARQRKVESFTERRKSVLRQIEDERERLVIKERDGLSRLVRELRGLITDFGSSRELQIIIENDPRVVAYQSGRLDITPEVLAFVNEKAVGR